MEQWILALETSSLRGSVALGLGAQLRSVRALSPDRRHTTELLPVIAELLRGAGARPAEVAVLAFSQGPGSFTGLRVAATVARMWQSTTGCQVVGVPTLQAIARNALPEGIVGKVPVPQGGEPGGTPVPQPGDRVVVLGDARQGRLFAGEFDIVGPDELCAVAPAELREAETWLAGLTRNDVETRRWMVLGDGVTRYRDRLEGAGATILPEGYWWPLAGEVLKIGAELAAAGRFCRPEEIVPVYVRKPEYEEVYEQRRAEAKARRLRGE